MDATLGVAGSTLGSTLLAVGGLQTLKNWKKFPLIQEGAKAANRVASLAIAFGIAVGINVTFKGSAGVGWAFTGSIPPVYTILVGLFHWGSQFIFQETGYSVLQGLQAMTNVAKFIQQSAPQGGAGK